jgi:hypothetical protein
MAGIFTDRRLNQDASAAVADATVSQAPATYASYFSVAVLSTCAAASGSSCSHQLPLSSPAKRSAAGNGAEPHHKHKNGPIPEVALSSAVLRWLLEFSARFTPLNRWNIAAFVLRAWEGFQPCFHFALVDIRDAHTFNAAP